MSCGCVPHIDLRAPIERALARGLTRREAIRSLSGGLSLAIAGCATIPEKDRVAAREIGQTSPSVDLHAHPGFFPTSPLSMEDQIARMGQGRLRAALFASVADSPLIRRRSTGGLYAAREPQPGELYTATWRQIERVRARTAAPGLTLVRAPGEVAGLGDSSRPGAILAVEGGDFLEGRVDRVEEAYRRDVRSIQLVHYRINELGDIQTEPARHGGLTPFGKDVIREMNRLGMVIDLAHLTHDGVRDAVAVTTKPIILSHTVLETPFARAISRAHAQLIAKNGGVVGIFPVNSTYRGFAGYITHIERMIEAIGVDHVGIGTDMDGISPPSFLAWDDYREWPTLGAALLSRGHSAADVAKVTGGNFRHVFAEVAAV